MAPTVVLITGSNRGIGRGLLELYLARPDHTVIAAVRDPGHATAQELPALPRAPGTSLVIVKLDVAAPADAAAAAAELASRHGITHVDVFVANAGIALCWPRVSEVTAGDIQRHVDVNVHGFVSAFQAFRSALQRARNPKWVTIGSSAAFLTYVFAPAYMVLELQSYYPLNFLPIQNAAYAPTKLVQHWLTKAIHTEEPWLTAFPIDPGWVQTDLGQRGADTFGVEKPPVTVEESVDGVIKVIDAATRETHSGRLWVYTGKESAW